MQLRHKLSLRWTVKLIASCGLILCLAGCGQKGDLYRTDPGQPTSQNELQSGI